LLDKPVVISSTPRLAGSESLALKLKQPFKQQAYLLSMRLTNGVTERIVKMEFVLQQPGTARLLAAIDDAASGADSGGGAFAFASKGGIDALFDCPNIAQMLKNGHPFHLIIGIDAITNAEALLCLHDKLELFPESLSIDIFSHEYPSSIFHPKFCWFQQGDMLRLVTGSGNLTLRGLGQASEDGPPLGNWEAFSVQSLTDGSAAAAQTEIQNWLAAQRAAGTLRSHNDEKVRERAMANGRVRFISRTAEVTPAAATAADEVLVPSRSTALIDDVVLSTPEVLIREVSQNRSGQGDVGKKALEEFFGYAGTKKTILIQHVAMNNTLGAVYETSLHVNKSKNYRVELRAIAEFKDRNQTHGGDDSRMILVAVKLDLRSFRYTIVPVTDENYTQLSTLLGPIPPANKANKRHMRESFLTPEALLAVWLAAPSNLLPVTLLTPEP